MRNSVFAVVATTVLAGVYACSAPQDELLPGGSVERTPGVAVDDGDEHGGAEHFDEVVLDVDDTAPSDDETSGAFSAAASTDPVVLFLNGRGATMREGRNDSALNTSQIVKGTTTFPASSLRNDPTRWGQLVATVKKAFDRYNVVLVDEEPRSGAYLEAVITSGSPSLIGYGSGLAGIAPTRCGIVDRSVVFVFEGRMGAVAAGEVVAHEFGHSLSLSHTQTPSDLMSYYDQPNQAFQDLEALCGPRSGQSQTCNCGGSRQNNHRQLLQFVGAVRTSAPPPTSPPPPTDADAGAPPPPPPTTAPSVAILEPADNSTYTAGTTVLVRADVSKVPALSSAALRWRIGSTIYQYRCPSSRCTYANGQMTWRMVPGTGTRTFQVRATDSSGAVHDSPTHTIRSK